jgi:uncharacterized flavoprotein (TIGR03862 family)
VNIAIIGGGPAGLRAAEVASAAGAAVTLYDGKASVGRKFLVAGRGGLNLTKQEPQERFVTRYRGPDQPPELWRSLIAECDVDALRAWAAGLGVETFAASTGRVYPRELKAAPLLRRWVQRLRGAGVQFAMHHRWIGLQRGAPLQLEFAVGEEMRTASADAVVLALGGGSWPETGSDGSWTGALQRLGVSIASLQPANCGWEYPWPAELLATAEGQPLKNIAAHAGAEQVAGELLITSYGLEGGAIYQLGAALRAMGQPVLTIDLKPSSTTAQLAAKLGSARGDLLTAAAERWRLTAAGSALLRHVSQGSPSTGEQLAALAKACPLHLTGPRPLAEAISSAGGIRWSEVDDRLMLRRLPGVFVAGEMIDWEAPTGGYLIHGCFAMGTRAAEGALQWSGGHP